MGSFNSKPNTLKVPRKNKGPAGRKKPSRGFLRRLFRTRQDGEDLFVDSTEPHPPVPVPAESFDAVTSEIDILDNVNKSRPKPPRKRRPTKKIHSVAVNDNPDGDDKVPSYNDEDETVPNPSDTKKLPPALPSSPKPTITDVDDSNDVINHRVSVSNEMKFNFLNDLNKKLGIIEAQEPDKTDDNKGEVSETDSVHFR